MNASILQSIQAGIREQIRGLYETKEEFLLMARHTTNQEVKTIFYKRADKLTERIKKLERNLKYVKSQLPFAQKLEKFMHTAWRGCPALD